MTTQTSTHTPGPWSTAREGMGWLVYSEYGRGDEGARHYPAQVVDTEANAKLIAAAPQLLEALQDIAKNHYPECSCPTPECEMTCTNGVARAAIEATRNDK